MAKKIVVLISKAVNPKAAEVRMHEAIVAELASRPHIEVRITPSIYDLPADGKGVAWLRAIQGDMIVLGWIYPRGMFWALRAHGVTGRMGAMPSMHPSGAVRAVAVEKEGMTEASARTVWCLDLRVGTQADVIAKVDRIASQRHLPGGAARSKIASPVGAFPEESVISRWYPVVDYDRCQNCLECLNFCLFGVYGLDEDERLLTEQPDACRNGCPACARVCPAQAIMFPMYVQKAIAGGEEEANSAASDVDSPQSNDTGATSKAVAERKKALASKSKSKAARPAAQRGSKPTDRLDGLVDDLDQADL